MHMNILKRLTQCSIQTQKKFTMKYFKSTTNKVLKLFQSSLEWKSTVNIGMKRNILCENLHYSNSR